MQLASVEDLLEIGSCWLHGGDLRGQSVNGRAEPLPLSIANDDLCSHVPLWRALESIEGLKVIGLYAIQYPRDRRSYLRVDAQDAAPTLLGRASKAQRMVLEVGRAK